MQYIATIGGGMLATYAFASISPPSEVQKPIPVKQLEPKAVQKEVQKETTQQQQQQEAVQQSSQKTTFDMPLQELADFYQSRRQWKQTFAASSSSPDSGNSAPDLTLMSYNVLADGRYINSHREDCDEKFLDWSYRWKLISSQLMAYEPDIVAFQEITEDMFWKSTIRDDMKSLFGMKGLHAPKHRVKGNFMQSDSLFYNSDKFDLVSTRTVYLRDIAKTIENSHYFEGPTRAKVFPDATGNGKGYKTQFWEKIKSMHTTCIIALFARKDEDAQVSEEKENNKSNKNKYFCVCATHLFFHPSFGDTKAAQAYLLNNAIYLELEQMLASKGINLKVEDVPIVIGVDANAMPKSCDEKFDPYLNSDDFLSRMEKIDGVEEGHLAPILKEKSERQTGVYELFTKGRLPPTHPEHAIGRFNIRSMCSELDEMSDKSGDDREYKEVMGTWDNKKFDKLSEFEGLKSFNYEWTTPIKFSSVYRELNEDLQEPLYTTKVGWFDGCIDYIWINNGFEVNQILDWEHDGKLPMDKVYPNEYDPSDHLPLAAKLTIKKKE